MTEGQRIRLSPLHREEGLLEEAAFAPEEGWHLDVVATFAGGRCTVAGNVHRFRFGLCGRCLGFCRVDVVHHATVAAAAWTREASRDDG